MRLDEDSSGRPFEGDYAAYGHDNHDETRRVVARQVVDLIQRRYQPAVRHALLAAAQRSRAGRSDLVQFDILPREVGSDVLVGRGDIVLTSAAYRQAGARAILDAFGLVRQDPTGVDELDARVVLARNPELDASTLSNVAKLLRSRDFYATNEVVHTLAPVGKGIGGTEPIPGPGTFTEEVFEHGGPAVPTAIIDNGITREIRTDGWLVAVPRTNDNIDPLDDVPADGDLDSAAGHGTFVAGIVAQVARGAADIRMYRAMDSAAYGTDLQVAAAMIKAVKDDHCEIVNLSLGGQTAGDVPPVAIKAALDVIRDIEHARGTRVVIVAAAGNTGDTSLVWPAAFPEVVSVAGLRADMTPALWSTFGTNVDFSVIAEATRSTYVQGTESPFDDPEPDTYGPNAWALWSGTSFAAPQISGAIARVSRALRITPHEALLRLLRTGRPILQFGQALQILPGL